MAIAEAEPKKSEVAVTSAGVSDGIKEKVLNAGKNLTENKGYAGSSTSTSVGTVKKYNLYDNIKGFRFEMPDGWNDEDIGLFVTCCWEKKDDFSKSNVDRTKIWADIAQSGAEQSRNPSLFTINSCLALAERIRYYVSKNSSVFLDNEAFMKFHSDVKGLLPHFSDNFDTKKVMENKCNRRKVKSKTEYKSVLLNNDSGLGDVIHDLALENAEAIKSGNRNVWTEMSNKLKEHLGLNPDVKTILESEKNKIISTVARMVEKGIDKKSAFIESARGFIEVFDYINPKKIKVSDYLRPSGTDDSIAPGKDKSVSKLKRPNYNNLPENTSFDKGMTGYSIEDKNDVEDISPEKKTKRSRAQKSKRTRSKVVESKGPEDVNDNQEAAIEPSSTTPLDDHNLQPQQQATNVKVVKKRKSFASGEDLEKTTSNINTGKNYGRSKETKVSPRRIMPPRLARNKVISYALSSRSIVSKEMSRSMVVISESTIKNKNQPKPDVLTAVRESDREVAKNSPNFIGFDTDSEEATIDFTDRFKKTKGAKNISPALKNIANPDTTTKDLDEKNSRNMSDNDVPFIKRVNRKRKEIMNKKQGMPSKQEEELGSKVRIVHADCTMKNLVVKLVDCHGSIDNPSHDNIIKPEKSNLFNGRIRPDRSKEVRLIEESAALAKDVVDSEYNPSSDSAKLVSDEHLNNGHFSGLRNETKRVVEPAAMPISATSLKDSNQLTKHPISPFYEFSKYIENDNLRATADSSEDIGSVGSVKMAAFRNAKLQDNSVSSPYSASAGSSSLDADQIQSTSSDNVNSTTMESALATLKKCRKEFLSTQDNDVCVTTSEVFDSNQFLTRIEDAPLPEWFGAFVTDFRKHEAWKIQQLFKMQQEITDVEHRKVLLLEKILGSLVNE